MGDVQSILKGGSKVSELLKDGAVTQLSKIQSI